MFSKRSAFSFVVILALLVGLGACTPQTSTAPPDAAPPEAPPPDAPVPEQPTPPPALAEPEGWVFYENWWLEPQIMAQTPGTYPDPEGNPIELSKLLDYDAYNNAGLTVMNFYQADAATIQDLHDRDIFVVAADSMMSTYKPAFQAWSDLESPPELMEAAVYDPFGNIYSDPLGLDMFEWGQDTVFMIYSILHPTWQEHMLAKMKAYVDAGVDGYLFDELAVGRSDQFDFNPYTMQLFATYLTETYSQEELQALGEPWGINDFTNFDYAAVVREYLPNDMTIFTMDDWYNGEIMGNLPLIREYQRFLYVANQETALHLIAETRAYALETRGIYLPVSTNADPLVPPAIYIMDKVDFFTSEIPYSDYDYFPGARTLAPLKLGQYFDIQLSFLSQLTARPQMADWGKDGTVNLYRTMIADAVASGGAFNVEIDNQDLDQDMDALGPYYHFAMDYPLLFEGTQPVQGEIGVLQLWESMLYSPYDHPALLGLFDLLSDAGYQAGAIFGGGEEFVQWGEDSIVPAPDYPLSLGDLAQYKVVMIPELYNLTENHAATLLEYVEEGGTLVIFSTPETTGDMDAGQPLLGQILSARGRGATLVGEGQLIHINGVWGRDFIENPDPATRTQLVELLEAEGLQPEVRMSDTRYLAATAYTGADKMVVHFVNYDHEEGVDITTLTEAVEVEINLPVDLQPDIPGLYLFTPGEMPRELDGVISGDKLQLTLPEVYIWSVLLIGEKGLLDEEVMAFPTPTPTSEPTPTMHPGTFDAGYVIYDDSLAPGWGPGWWGSEAIVDSTTAVYDGTRAIEITAQQDGGFGFFTESPLALAPYEWLVFYINIGETTDPVFSVQLWYQDDPVNIFMPVEITPYIEGGQLTPGSWHQVAMPVSVLNPEGSMIDQVNINYQGTDNTVFYFDEIRFVAAGMPPTPTSTPTPLPSLSSEVFDAVYVVYDDMLSADWSLDPWSGTADLTSSVTVYEGSNAIEVSLEPSGAITFDNVAFDALAYDYIVFYINGGDTTDQQIYVEMNSGDGPPLGRASLDDFIEGYPLQPGQWHLVVVPLSLLNPSMGNFGWFDIGDASGNGAATFYIDEIRFVTTGP